MFRHEDIRVALTQDGLGHATAEAIAFVDGALSSAGEWPKGIDLRGCGRQLSKEELRERGYRSSLRLSEECLDILTDKGRQDPAESTQFIVSALVSRDAKRAQLARTKAAGVRKVKIRQNSMAAGPCPACIALSKRTIPIDDAPLGPLPECPRPSQCVLIIQSVLDWDD